MAKILNKLVTILCVSILFVSGIGCASKTTQPALEKQAATVQRGNLAIPVSVDGNLVMPQAFDLLFGAPGNVEDVLVEEGDFVKAGQILARLDDTAQRLDIMSANNNVQTKLSNLYETVPLLPQFPSTSYDADVVTITGAPVTTPPEVHTYFDPPDTLPPAGTTTVTTRTGNTPGTMTSTTTTTTITYTPGPVLYPGTTTVTTIVTKTVTKTTTTLLASPPGSILGYPGYYPNATAWASFVWAQYEVTRARELFQAGNYTDAASELYV